MATLYDRIKSRRIELGLTVEELAHKMGYKDKSSISKIENGKADIPQSKIAAFADALETTTAYLMGWEERPGPSQPTQKATIPPGFIPMPKMVKVPLVGSIACGTPILAEQNIDGHVDAPEDIRCDFALRCKGDSMIGAGIHDGDAVYIHIQPEVENGEIAAVRIGEEATLKRVYLHTDYIELRPENSVYESIIRRREEMNDVHIEGKAVGYTHWF
nr:MAG TPA: LexA repressor [Caudoviricetes sp.]